MVQDGSDGLPVFNEADDAHDSPTLRAGQGIDLVNLLNQPGPVLPVFLRIFIGLQDAGNPFVFGFFSLSSGDVTVIPIVSDNDLPKVGTPEPIRPFEPLLVHLNKGFKMVFHAPVIIGR